MFVGLSPLRNWAHLSPKPQSQERTSPWLEQLLFLTPPPTTSAWDGRRAEACLTGGPEGSAWGGERWAGEAGRGGACTGDSWPHAPRSGRKCFISHALRGPLPEEVHSLAGVQDFRGPRRTNYTHSELGRLPPGLCKCCALCVDTVPSPP